MRILSIYAGESTDILGPLERKLEDKYDAPRLFHVPADGVEDFIFERQPFDIVFFDSSIDSSKINTIFANSKSTEIIKGVRLTDDEVKKFFPTVEKKKTD